MNVLLTGATGFLGSHVADRLLEKGHSLLCLKRPSSRLSNCTAFEYQVKWTEHDWINQAIEFVPDVIVHTAWSGVDTSGRDNWDVQLFNIDLAMRLVTVAQAVSVKKIIALGSQAEYGTLSSVVTEEHPLCPTTAYGCVKLAVLRLLRTFAELHGVNWYWLRVFSIFGERESPTWLIPSTIKKMLAGETEIDFSPGEQKYAYLYVKDFANALVSVVEQNGSSGIYNLSSSRAETLQTILQLLKIYTKTETRLNFGKLPYRPGQSMHIEGDSTKFKNTFGTYETTDLTTKLKEMVAAYSHESI